MRIDKFNLNTFRVFESVYRTRSMTESAGELHLTQSAISQQISKLEGLLETKLFDRVGRVLLPTEKGNTLFSHCQKAIAFLERGVAKTTARSEGFAGRVVIGVPIEFGNAVIIPKIAAFCAKQPNIRVRVRYGFASDMEKHLMAGKLDFAFVDSYRFQPAIRTKKIYEEVLCLCAAQSYWEATSKNKKLTLAHLQSLRYVDYGPGEPVLRMWFKHHFQAFNVSLDCKVALMDVQGVANLIINGAGLGVLPDHKLTQLRREGHRIHVVERASPLKNPIAAAYVAARTFSGPAQALFNYLIDSLS